MRPRLIAVVSALVLSITLAATLLLLPGAAAAQSQKITKSKAIEIAKQDPKAIAVLGEHPNLAPSASRNDATGLWEVGFFNGGDEVVQVVIDPVTGNIIESWTGYQVAWRMARGYPGAFGRMINAPYVWLPLCAIFVLGLLDWRRPFRLAHLDLLVIVAGFGLSHYFFNNGQHRALGSPRLSAAALPARAGALARVPPRPGVRPAAIDADRGPGGDDRGSHRRPDHA